MGHDPIRQTDRLWSQFSLWSLVWLVALASVFLAAFRGGGGDGLLVSIAALTGAVGGRAMGESIATGRLAAFGTIAGGASGGLFSAGCFAIPVGLGLGLGLAVGGCWLLLTADIPLAPDDGEPEPTRPPSIHERLRDTRRSLLEAALIVAAGGIVLATALGTLSFATANPLDRWFLALRVFLLSAGAVLLVSATLAGLSFLLALAGPRSTEDRSRQESDEEEH